MTQKRNAPLPIIGASLVPLRNCIIKGVTQTCALHDNNVTQSQLQYQWVAAVEIASRESWSVPLRSGGEFKGRRIHDSDFFPIFSLINSKAKPPMAAQPDEGSYKKTLH